MQAEIRFPPAKLYITFCNPVANDAPRLCQGVIAHSGRQEIKDDGH